MNIKRQSLLDETGIEKELENKLSLSLKIGSEFYICLYVLLFFLVR